MRTLLNFFGTDTASQVNGARCRRYAEQRSSDAAARRELEDLRAAFNHYHREGLMREKIAVSLPQRRPARERYLERNEAAALICGAWRYRETGQFGETVRHTRRHIARFIIVGLYAGRRAGAIVTAALRPTPGKGFVDLDRGVFHPPARLRQTKKRQPAIPLPRRLLAHMRRWKKNGQQFGVEWNGQPVSSIDKAFRANARSAGLTDVTPHTLRHTAATWMMQRKADPWATAGYLGMSIETLIRTYGHHHPDHLKDAWSVFDRPGGTIKPKAPRPKAHRKPAHAPKRQRRRMKAGRRG